MQKLLGANWISTVVGQAIGIINGYFADGGQLSWKAFLAYAVPAVLGLIMKDWNTTGTGSGASKAPDVNNAPIK